MLQTIAISSNQAIKQSSTKIIIIIKEFIKSAFQKCPGTHNKLIELQAGI